MSNVSSCRPEVAVVQAHARPHDLHDREQEWADLTSFATADGQGLQLGVLYGRRRQGKSYLLRRLCRSVGGMYSLALEQERAPALARFSAAAAEWMGWPTAALGFGDWEPALRAVLRAVQPPPVLVIDELPYLLRHSPELPSVLQALVDEAVDDPPPASTRVILCGSAISVMHDLLSGTRALRGRAQLDLALQPLDFRAAAALWEAGDPDVALHVHAILGGTPGYRDVLGRPAPRSLHELGDWLAATILNPSHALFREEEYLLREDPRLTDRALYHSVLTAVSAGASTPSAIGGRLGRDGRSLAHPLATLLTSGFLRREEDVLLQRRGTLVVADPIIRFARLIVEPRLATFEDRRTAEGWSDAAATFGTQILGPHFEELARAWTRRFASTATLGGVPGEVGRTVVNDPGGRARHEIDVVALAAGQRPQRRDATILALGEAKASAAPRGVGDLARLERGRELLSGSGAAAAEARLLVFGRAGFTAELRGVAGRRHDIELIDLERLYSGA